MSKLSYDFLDIGSQKVERRSKQGGDISLLSLEATILGS